MKVSVVVPTLDNERTLRQMLASLREQDWDGDVETICIDGGSRDATLRIARDYGARIVENPEREEEAGRALGIEAADGELVLLLDADNVLPARHWLARLVRALELAPDIVAADSLYHEWRRGDPPVVRLCALIGGTDPLAVELGWADRWAWHLDRWTGMPVLETQDAGDALLVRLDPDRPPPLGSNGFLVRRAALLETSYRPFVHSDVAGDLAAAGHRFARVKQGIVHDYAPDLRTYFAKARRRARRATAGLPVQRRGYRPTPARLLATAGAAATQVIPLARAAHGFRQRRDPAWALYPVLYDLTLLAYALEFFRRNAR